MDKFDMLDLLCDTLDEIGFSDKDDFLCCVGPSFQLVDGKYELEIKFDGGSVENISLDVIGEKQVRVLYQYETTNSRTKYVMKESLPSDADPETLDAFFKNGTLTITVNKKS